MLYVKKKNHLMIFTKIDYIVNHCTKIALHCIKYIYTN